MEEKEREYKRKLEQQSYSSRPIYMGSSSCYDYMPSFAFPSYSYTGSTNSSTYTTSNETSFNNSMRLTKSGAPDMRIKANRTYGYNKDNTFDRRCTRSGLF